MSNQSDGVIISESLSGREDEHFNEIGTTSESQELTMSIQERRERNILRNKEKLNSVFGSPSKTRILSSSSSTKPNKRKKRLRTSETISRVNTGMVFQPPTSRASSFIEIETKTDDFKLNRHPLISSHILLNELYSKYPFRETQIKILFSLFQSIILRQQIISYQKRRIPPPTFLIGPAGTAKTSILLDMLQGAKQNSLSENFGYVYMDCAMIGTSCETITQAKHAVCDFLQDALQQIKRTISSGDKSTNEHNDCDSDLDLSSLTSQFMMIQDDGDIDSTRSPLDENYVEKQRKGINHNIQSSTSSSHGTTNTDDGKILKQRDYNGTLILAFGRTLLPLLSENRPGILVIDRAERLLTLTSFPSSYNLLLSQILLLPKTMGLNLWIVCVTSRVLLPSTNISPKGSNIQDCLQPIKIHFDAYKGPATFKKILTTPCNKNKIVRNLYDKKDIEKMEIAYNTMLDSLIVSAQDSTRDVREISRLAQMLWPTYFHLVKSKTLGETDIQKNSLKLDLDIEGRYYIKELLANCLFKPSNTITATINNQNKKKDKLPAYLQNLPDITLILLLAAFLSQHNPSNIDQNLYTNKRKGRRKKGRKKQKKDSQNMENSNNNKRATTFPLERLLSIFSFIFSQYGDPSFLSSTGKQKQQTMFTGTTPLFSSLSELKKMGLIHSIVLQTTLSTATKSSMSSTSGTKKKNVHTSSGTKSAVIEMNNPKYTCALSWEYAELISESIGFPLFEFCQFS